MTLAILVGVAIAAATTLYHNAIGHVYGTDFRGIWRAAQMIASGHDPYPPARVKLLGRLANPYVLPPLVGLLVIPLGKLPFAAAIVIWNLIAVAGLGAALRLLGVRDARVYVLALCSFPFVSSLVLGQPDGVFALLAALAWRHRGSWVGGLAVGVLVAAKLLMWPLIVWLLLCRRLSAAATAVVSAAVITVGTWAIIGFDGFTGYPALLSADSRGFETDSHSVAALAIRLGTTRSAAFALGLVCAAVAVAGLLLIGRERELSGFLAAIVAGLLVSPLMWSHYLVVLFVPLAVVKRRASLAWLLVAGFWVSPSEPPASVWQVAAVLALFGSIAMLVSRAGELEQQPLRPRAPLPAQPS